MTPLAIIRVRPALLHSLNSFPDNARTCNTPLWAAACALAPFTPEIRMVSLSVMSLALTLANDTVWKSSGAISSVMFFQYQLPFTVKLCQPIVWPRSLTSSAFIAKLLFPETKGV